MSHIFSPDSVVLNSIVVSCVYMSATLLNEYGMVCIILSLLSLFPHFSLCVSSSVFFPLRGGVDNWVWHAVGFAAAWQCLDVRHCVPPKRPPFYFLNRPNSVKN